MAVLHPPGMPVPQHRHEEIMNPEVDEIFALIVDVVAVLLFGDCELARYDVTSRTVGGALKDKGVYEALKGMIARIEKG